MDIVTHAMMGLVLASPILPQAPLTGSLLALGCCLPDLDSFSRCFGKSAFLRWHQTYTHSLAFVAACGLLAWRFCQSSGESLAVLGLVAGLLIHIGLDCSNTFGATALWPMSSRRWSTQWLFFIDASITVVTAIALLLAFAPPFLMQLAPSAVTGPYIVFLVIYVALRAMIACFASRHALPGTLSLAPSAFLPWRFFGVASDGADIRTYQLDGLRGRVSHEKIIHALDAKWAHLLTPLREFQAMNALSPAYRVVSAVPTETGTVITCRDLRIRNFGGRFGEMQLWVDVSGNIVRREFHV